MLNLMKADVYRVFKGKAFWITLLVLLVFLVMNALTGTIGTMGMNNESLSNLMKTEPDLNGSLTQLYQMATADNLFYFFLPIIVAVITTDFVSGTARNVLAQGVSRTKYYLSKLLLVGLLSSTFIIIYETLPFAIATIKFGVGNYFDTFNFWRILLTQIPIYLAVISIGTLIALTFKKTATLNAIYISMFIVSQVIISILITINDKFLRLMDFELALRIRKYVFEPNITNENIFNAIILGTCVIIVTTVLGIMLFRKSEIK